MTIVYDNVNDILEGGEKYLCVICNCIETAVKPDVEANLSRVYEKYPYANAYMQRKISGKRGKPGSIEIKGNGKEERYIVNIFSQFYPGQTNFPNDSPERRLTWFKKALAQISDLNHLDSLGFDLNLIQESVGRDSVPEYTRALEDFDKVMELKGKNGVRVVLYGGLTGPEIEPIAVCLNNIDRSVILTLAHFKKLKVDKLEKVEISRLIEKVEGWNDIFKDAKIQEILISIDPQFQKEVEKHGEKIYPPLDLVFNAFQQSSFQGIKVVILGQDPYHNKGEAMGLSFSVPQGIRIPPSLQNIFLELKTDLPNFTMPQHGDLTAWAQQGVLLLNTSLTVVHNKPGSHLHIWQNFTDRVIEIISEKAEHPLIFLLWGLAAKKKQNLIDTKRHIIFTASHPSPLSANKGGWFGNKHFSKTNQELRKMDLSEIKF